MNRLPYLCLIERMTLIMVLFLFITLDGFDVYTYKESILVSLLVLWLLIKKAYGNSKR